MRNPANFNVEFCSAAAGCRIQYRYVYAIGNTYTEARGKVVFIRHAKRKLDDEEKDPADHEDLPKYVLWSLHK